MSRFRLYRNKAQRSQVYSADKLALFIHRAVGLWAMSGTEREPAGPYRLKVPPRRTRHIRFNDPSAP